MYFKKLPCRVLLFAVAAFLSCVPILASAESESVPDAYVLGAITKKDLGESAASLHSDQAVGRSGAAVVDPSHGVAPAKDIPPLAQPVAVMSTENGPKEKEKVGVAPPPVSRKERPADKAVVVSPVKTPSEMDAVFGSSTESDLDLSGTSSLKVDMMSAMSLEEAVSRALKENDDTQSFKARIDGAKWDKAGAYAQYIPSVEVNYAEGAEKSLPGSYNDASGSRVSETLHHRRDRSFYIRQPIIDLAVVADVMRTDSSLDVTMAELRDNQETTAYATVTAYLKLLEAHKAVEFFDDHKKLLNALSQRMRARLEEGGATAADMNRIQSRVNVADAARLEALSQYGINIAEFKRLTKVVPAKLVTPPKLVTAIPATAELALDVAYKSNPAYLAALKKIDLARGDRDKAFAGALPRLSVELSDSYVYDAGGAAHGNPVDGVYPNQRDKRAMVVGRWSLTGGTALTSGMSGVQKMKEMSFKAQDTRSRIEQSIHVGYDALNAARKRIKILKASYETDSQIVTDLEEQFMQGERSLFEILDSQDRLHTTKVELMHAMFTEALTAYQIRMQMGEIAQAVLGNGAAKDGE